MLVDSLSLLRDELQAYIENNLSNANVVLENIALLDTPNGDLLTDNVVISLVNMEEESTLKNVSSRRNTTLGYEYTNPPTYLNLYLLFTANFNGGQHPNNKYLLALRHISMIVQFFQTRKQFTLSNSPNAGLAQNPQNFDDVDLLNLELTLELYTLTFEQINHLWGSLGGRQIPFVMYKARLVAIQERAMQTAGIIEEINTDHKDLNTP